LFLSCWKTDLPVRDLRSSASEAEAVAAHCAVIVETTTRRSRAAAARWTIELVAA
jgi:hypothetical protein